jgi:hypothetical protein
VGTAHLMHAFVTLQLAKCDSILLQFVPLFVFPAPDLVFHEQASIVVAFWAWILDVPCLKLICDSDCLNEVVVSVPHLQANVKIIPELGCAHLLPHTV